MNLEWTKEFFKSDHWDDSDFERYGLSEKEAHYAWALTEVDELTLDEINKYILVEKQEFWQINSTNFYLDGDQIIITDCWKDKSYDLPYVLFAEHVKSIINDKKSS